MKYNKLVRDNVPQIIEKKGGAAILHTATEEEYWMKLKEKLTEEVREFSDSEDPEELADILEVIYAIAEVKSLKKETLEVLRQKKAEERGGFKKKIILEES